MARVNAAEWWPSHRCTCTAFPPRSKRIDAQVCLNVWKPAHGAPASSAAGRRARRRTFSTRSGVPAPLGKTRSSSPVHSLAPRCFRRRETSSAERAVASSQNSIAARSSERDRPLSLAAAPSRSATRWARGRRARSLGRPCPCSRRQRRRVCGRKSGRGLPLLPLHCSDSVRNSAPSRSNSAFTNWCRVSLCGCSTGIRMIPRSLARASTMPLTS